MKTKFGAIIVAGSGKINGFVASRNRAGSYLRTKVTPVNPQSVNQLTVRSRLTSISQSWRGLTPAQRASFNSAVADFARTDIFGDIKNPTGFNLYQRLNNNLVTVGAAQITSAPLPGPVSTVLLTALLGKIAGSLVDLTLSGAVPAGTAVKVFATPGVSAGISFVKSEFRLVGTFAAASATPLSIGVAWAARFGTLVLGQKIFVRIVFVNTTTGQESAPQSLSTIVVA